jgi:hypothetical protein
LTVDARFGRRGDDDAVTTSDPTDPTDPTVPTDATGAPTSAVPADPAAYDSERSAAARRRGLSTPYIPGGRDPDQAGAERAERRDLRILVGMVVAIVLAGFVFGILAALLGFDGLVARPA